MKSIPYGKQSITQEDIDAVVAILQSEFLTQGPNIAAFENAFASYIGCKYAVAVANGTAGLHIAAMALGTSPDSTVITTPITFVASANGVRYSGGNVVFGDIDPDTYLLDINSVRKILQSSPKGNYSGIIPVDFAGKAVNLEELRALADEYGLWILEDACHSPGGYFVDSTGKKQFCGNGNFADAAVFSFHPVKHIACGEGGMVTTNDQEIYKQLLRLRSHGITKGNDGYLNSLSFANGGDESVTTFPGWYMEMQQLGFNYRITDFQAALGNSQLNRADEGLAKRREIAEKYNNAFKNEPFIIGHSGYDPSHAYHLYVIEVRDRLGLYNYLREHEIYAQVHYIPAHLMPYYRQFGWKEGDLPNAENYYKHCLSIPMYPTLTEEEQDFVIEKIKEFYNS